MRTAGIICECNPFHEGHRYLITQARKGGADAVICLMSGCFTQRGEPAVLHPRGRAQMLLAGGADAVLELPFPHSSAGAEFFASAGVSVFERLGVDELWFGSECGDASLLRRAAELTVTPQFADLYRARCADSSQGTAQAYADCLTELGNIPPLSPNDLLGVAYCKALHAHSSAMEVRVITRVGSAYSNRTLTAGQFPSATALRCALYEKGIDALTPYLPACQLDMLKQATDAGLAPARSEQIATAILAHLRLTPAEVLEQIPELGGGLGRRIASVAVQATDLQELLAGAVTKKYTASRILRGILFAMTGITASDIRNEPAYTVLLAANRAGCRFLSEKRRSSDIPVVTSHSGIPDTPAAKRQEELTRRSFALYTLCLPKPYPADKFLRASAWIEP